LFGLFDPGVVFERLQWPNDFAGEVEAIGGVPFNSGGSLPGNWNCSLVPTVGFGSIHAVEASLSSAYKRAAGICRERERWSSTEKRIALSSRPLIPAGTGCPTAGRHNGQKTTTAASSVLPILRKLALFGAAVTFNFPEPHLLHRENAAATLQAH
jgi:hypothetical protein